MPIHVAAFLSFALFSASLAAIKWPRQVLMMAIFFAPWEGLEIEAGVRITAYRFLMAALLIKFIMVSLLRLGWKERPKVPVLFGLLMLYAGIRSIAQIPLLEEGYVAGGILRSVQVRSFVQVAMFALDLCPIVIIPTLLKTREDLIASARVYVVSLLILTSLGWFQILTVYSTGWNPLPIGYIKSLVGDVTRAGIEEPREASAEFSRGGLYRMNSLGGEPRNLACGITIGLIILQVVMVYRTDRNRPWLLFYWSFLFVSLLLTLSTTGIVLWTVGTITLGALNLARMRRTGGTRNILRWMLQAPGPPLVSLALLVMLVSFVGFRDRVDFIEVAQERTIGRDFIEDFDEAVLGYLRDNPDSILFGVGLGNVHLYADRYLPLYADYAKNTAFVAKTGALRWISELGGIGLLLFLAWAVREYRTLRRVLAKHASIVGGQRDQWLGPVMVDLSIIMLVFYMARGNYLAAGTFLTLGSAAALKNLLDIEVRQPVGQEKGTGTRTLAAMKTW